MGDDLELSSNEYSVSLVVFFVTYVFFEAPSNMVSIPLIQITVQPLTLHNRSLSAGSRLYTSQQL